MRICVIGGGAAGLCAARHAMTMSSLTKLTVLESSACVGGTWVYTDEIGKDSRGYPVHSSMYKHMKTNLPKEVMAFPDYPINPSWPSFLTHQQVWQYLKDYAAHFNLERFIEFGRRVLQVTRKDGSWTVRTECAESRHVDSTIFDVVFVCNGHYFAPYFPNIEGKDVFEGLIMHSHNYRVPDVFAGQTVACLGAGPSGVDIAIELANVCPKVYLCHNHPKLRSKLPDNVEQRVGFSRFREKAVELTDASRMEVDAVIFCTGYDYQFPFLDESVALSVEDNRVSPLYQHLVHIEEPSLFFIGLCATICPFPNFDVQVGLAVSLLTDPSLVPSKETMLAWEEEDRKRRVEEWQLRRRARGHFLGPFQWTYLRELAQLGGFRLPVEPVVPKLYDHVHESRLENLVTYKSSEFRLVDSESFLCL